MDVKQRLIEMADGTYVEHDTLRIAERIQEYDPNLSLKYCATPDNLTDAPFILVELCKDGIERIVFEIWELDERVLEKIYAADNQYQSIEDMLTKTNEQAKKEQNRRYTELKDEQDAIAEAIIKTDKETYTFDNPATGDKVKVHQSRPVEVNDE